MERVELVWATQVVAFSVKWTGTGLLCLSASQVLGQDVQKRVIRMCSLMWLTTARGSIMLLEVIKDLRLLRLTDLLCKCSLNVIINLTEFFKLLLRD